MPYIQRMQSIAAPRMPWRVDHSAMLGDGLVAWWPMLHDTFTKPAESSVAALHHRMFDVGPHDFFVKLRPNNSTLNISYMSDPTGAGPFTPQGRPWTDDGQLFIDVDGEINDEMGRGPDRELQILGDVTVALWLATEEAAGSPRVVVGMQGTQTKPAGNTPWVPKFSDTQMGMLWEYDSGTDENIVFTHDGITAKDWHHVVFKRDTTTKTVHGMIDGVHQGSMAYTNDATGGSASSLDFFHKSDAAGWIGGVADVRIWARALSTFEMQAIYAPETRWSAAEQ